MHGLAMSHVVIEEDFRAITFKPERQHIPMAFSKPLCLPKIQRLASRGMYGQRLSPRTPILNSLRSHST